MSARSRKLIGIFLIIAGLTVYIAVVVTIATTWLPYGWAVQGLFYAVAGIAWAIPLKPLMAWMNKGEIE